jgi:hypothetical protein
MLERTRAAPPDHRGAAPSSGSRPAPLLGRLLDPVARADYELGGSLLSRETIAHHEGGFELFVTWCAEIVAEEQ